MDQEIKKKWVKVLLDPTKKQIKNKLKNDYGYCCLGLLREVMDKNDNTGSCDNSLLTTKQLKKAGLYEQPKIRYTIGEELAELNDFGVPFPMIAGLIDEAL
jgi:hypothetical protein